MYRALLVLVMAAAPAIVLLGATGCEPEVKTVHQKQTVQESEPQMVSPGQEVVE